MNKSNFNMATKASFIRCDKPDREPDYVSVSGSMYWHEADGVVRCADHWDSEISICEWSLTDYNNEEGYVAAYCSYKDFELKENYLTVCATHPENFPEYNFNKVTEFGKSCFTVRITSDMLKDDYVYFNGEKACYFVNNETMYVKLDFQKMNLL